MSLGDDLDRAQLGPLLGERPLRTFPVMMSTEAEALSWARKDAVSGSVVVAGHQISARGRSGLSYAEHFTNPAVGIGMSVVLRPVIAEEREGWLYLPAQLAILDVLAAQGMPARAQWPDRILVNDELRGMVGVQSEVVAGSLSWIVVTLLLPSVPVPRAQTVCDVLDALDRRLAQQVIDVLADYRAVCDTLGTRVLAKILPMGPASPAFVGEAVDVHDDGGLTIATDDGPRIVVMPQTLGFLEDPAEQASGPPGVG